jgi:hypothetical protein
LATPQIAQLISLEHENSSMEDIHTLFKAKQIQGKKEKEERETETETETET